MSQSRRRFLETTANGFGYLAFASMAAAASRRAVAAGPLAARPPHFAPRAARVIFLCMQGGPSHVDTFDHKPRLVADAGRAAPEDRASSARRAWPAGAWRTSTAT